MNYMAEGHNLLMPLVDDDQDFTSVVDDIETAYVDDYSPIMDQICLAEAAGEIVRMLRTGQSDHPLDDIHPPCYGIHEQYMALPIAQ
jgi:hypothetical protein